MTDNLSAQPIAGRKSKGADQPQNPSPQTFSAWRGAFFRAWAIFLASECMGPEHALDEIASTASAMKQLAVLHLPHGGDRINGR